MSVFETNGLPVYHWLEIHEGLSFKNGFKNRHLLKEHLPKLLPKRKHNKKLITLSFQTSKQNKVQEKSEKIQEKYN